MRYILLVLFVLVTTFASAQVQYLGSPTTTVRNRGNFVSDSLFYLPKRTKAPSDTGAIRYQISDSALYVWTGSAWRTAGTAGSAITGSGVAGYMPEFTTATNIDTTRLYHSNGRFAIGSTTTSNGVFNVYSGQSYMDSSLKIGNGELIVGSTSSASRKLYVTSNSDVARFEQTGSDKNMVIELLHTNPNASGTIREEGINFLSPNSSTRGRITFYPSDTFNVRNYMAFFTPSGSGTNAERMRITNDGNIGIGTTSPSSLLEVNATSPRIRVVGTTGGAINQYVTDGGQMFVGIDNSSASIFGNGAYSRVIYGGAAYPLDFYTNDLIRARIKSDGEVLIGTTTDAGAYALQVAGSIYNTTGAVLAASSGNVGIGTISPSAKLEVRQNMTTALAISHIGASSTALPSLTGDFGSLAFQNTNTTNNNYNSILWLNDESTISASIHGVYTSHSAGAQSGALIFGTRNSGTYAERFRMTSDGHLIQGTVIGPSAWSVGGGNNRAYQNGIANLYFDAGGNNAMEMTLASYYDGTNWKYQASSVGSGRYQITGANAGATHRWYVSAGGTTDGTISYTEAMRINASSELLLNTTTDAGAYALQVAGSIYNTTGAVLAASSGNVGIGTTSPQDKLDVSGAILTGNGLLAHQTNRGVLEYANNTTTLRSYGANSGDGLMTFRTGGGGGSADVERVRIKADGEVLIGTTTDAGTYALQVTGAIYNTTTITTGAPTSGSAKPWRLGEAATVSPTSPNRTIRVEIDGTVYYIHAKTTND